MSEQDCFKSTWYDLFVNRYELLAALILLHGVACVMNFADKKRTCSKLFHLI